MSAIMMPGGPVADATFADLAIRVEKLRERGHNPGLGTIIVSTPRGVLSDAEAREANVGGEVLAEVF